MIWAPIKQVPEQDVGQGYRKLIKHLRDLQLFIYGILFVKISLSARRALLQKK